MIPNFHIVDIEKKIWRGGQPVDQDWQYLKTCGFKQVIKLNTDGEGSDSPFVGDGTLYKCPITLDQQLLYTPIQIVIDAAGFIGPNTFIHCEHGLDRTGLICAVYRVMSGWSKERAEQEMLTLGFHKELLGLWHAWLEYAAPI